MAFRRARPRARLPAATKAEDRKTTRLQSSHPVISYALCRLKNKSPRAPHRAAAPLPLAPSRHPLAHPPCPTRRSPDLLPRRPRARGRAAGDDGHLAAVGTFTDKLVRSGDGWRFAERVGGLDFRP